MNLRARIDRKCAGGRAILQGLDIRLQAGEILALVGPSGVGKTTALRILGGLDRDFAGHLDWGGVRPAIGTVFQEPRLLPWRTVRENVDLVRPADPGQTPVLLERLGLAGAADLYPRALSLGMARRAAVARALAAGPELLLLDEPFASLDPASAEHVRALILEFWACRRPAVVLVTHDRAEAAALADSILVLGPGTPRTIAVPPERRRARASLFAIEPLSSAETDALGGTP